MNGAILAGLGATAVAAIIVTFFVFERIWPWMLIGAAAVLAYGVRGIFAANHLIAALPPSLPKATLREPRD